MLLDEKIESLQNETKTKITYEKVAEILGLGSKQAAYNRVTRKQPLKKWEENALDSAFLNKNTLSNDIKQVTIPYYPDVVFSAGYGVEIYDDGAKEYITLDERLFRTDRGTKINPKNCELLTISGNSMSPKWEDGDRFILDKSATSFVDGQTFAFKLNGECYIKEICLLGKRAKAIPLNKNYDEFYIEPEDELQIFGRVVPKVRL